MAKRKQQYTEAAENPEEKYITVRYTGKGRMFVLNHYFDPERPETLLLSVTAEEYETKLKPYGVFEIVI